MTLIEETSKMELDEFIRSLEISKNDSFALLLGAGCSINSDIPSAYDCIWEWKKMIYKSNNPSCNEWIDNYRNPKVQEIIQNWLDNQGTYIDLNNSEEYSFYAKKCFPVDDNRRQYFQRICSNKSPSIGYNMIPLLHKHGMLDSVWTTNFDDLVLNSCISNNVTCIDIGLDTVNRIDQRVQSNNELPLIKLHGDFKYGELKNTEEELQEQDITFRNKLVDYLQNKHLIVLGYSGRDKSLMSTLVDTYSKKGGGRLYWCGYGSNANKPVLDLIKLANDNNRNAFYIPTEGFDNTLVNCSKFIVNGNSTLTNEYHELVKSNSQDNPTTPFKLDTPFFQKVLKSNCFGIRLPQEVFVFDSTITEKPWKNVKLRSLTDLNVSAVPFGGSIWSFGKIEDIQEAFNDVISGDILRKPIAEIKIHNSSMSFLFLSTICKMFAVKNKVKTDFKSKLWDESDFIKIRVANTNYKVFNGIRLSFKWMNGLLCLVINPEWHVEDEISKEDKLKLGLVFYHKIWNDKFNEYVDKWRKKLLISKQYEFPESSGSGFVFRIESTPIFTNIKLIGDNRRVTHNVPKKLIRLQGVQFKEVDLIFNTKNGNKRANDIHPMRGLLNNKPYSSDIDSMLENSINLAVICIDEHSDKLNKFLNKQNQTLKKDNPKDNYVIDYEGFNTIYGLSLNIPEIGTDSWRSINEPSSNNIKECSLEIARSIIENINTLSSLKRKQIVVIYIPSHWQGFTSFDLDGEKFDLHDYIKAYCAEKGITSQIIREETIKNTLQQCQINWWLSLSYFVKSLRTPWIINNTDKSTAFAGIGYSVNSKEGSLGHIVLGCSHIYSSTGEGLKYKLTKINEDKIKWVAKKPHLSYDDAYEFGLNVKSLFYESMNNIPKRVVIHKRTFFTNDEKDGILDSLFHSNKIEDVDLVEVNFEHDIKYVSSFIKDGKTQIDGFSVSRGTCIILSDNCALLWAHGVIPSVKNPNYKFFPGGRYIPKPLRITKHYGSGSLQQIATEILGLSKMNWNSMNMYSQLPATIDSSNVIARIGKLIKNKEKIEYDYRYFI